MRLLHEAYLVRDGTRCALEAFAARAGGLFVLQGRRARRERASDETEDAPEAGSAASPSNPTSDGLNRDRTNQIRNRLMADR